VHVDLFMSRLADGLTGCSKPSSATFSTGDVRWASFLCSWSTSLPGSWGEKHVRHSYAMRMGDEVVPIS
jgi:hypothetical protein